MLTAHVHAPDWFLDELHLLVFHMLLKQSNRIGVAQSLEFVGCHVLKPGLQTLVDPLVEEVNVISVVLNYVPDAILDVVFSQVHDVVNISKSNLWLNHPELCKMPRGVTVLSSESGPKRIDIAHSLAVVLNSQLA